MFKKKNEFSEKDIALRDMLAAREELARAEQMFDYANDDYFEIANTDLTIAQLKYDNAIKKLKKLCEDGKDIPQMNTIKSYATV